MNVDAIVEAANLGNVAAQIVVAVNYWNGCGVDKDKNRAVQFARRAAESGDAFAQYCLGLFLEAVSSDPELTGRGDTSQLHRGPNQLPVIFSWYKRSADQGFAPAQLAVSGCYQFGWGVTADLAAARAWAEKAASGGFAPAQEVLSHLYSEGIGGRIDKSAAFRWALAAANQGHAGGAYLVASAYEEGDGVERDEAAALQWYVKSAESGNWLAHSKLTQIYRLGLLGVDRDAVKASRHQQMSEQLNQGKARPGIRATFVLAGFDCPADRVTELLGVTPDATGQSGETRFRPDGSKYQVKDSYWEIGANCDSLMIDDHINKLIELLAPLGGDLKSVPGRPARKIDVAVLLSAHRPCPGMNLSPSIMAKLSHLEIEIDMSLYVVAGEASSTGSA